MNTVNCENGIFCCFQNQASIAENDQDGDDEVLVKLDQGGEELTVPRDSIYQVLKTYLLTSSIV